MSLLKVIAEYDRKMENYIASLEEDNARLRKQVNEMTNLMVSGVQTRERTMLELIMCGALRKPDPVTE